jgi:hypothetical protein
MFLCPPTSYAPGSQTALTATSTTLTALSSANVNTGSFTAPASGSVLVTVSFVAAFSAANPWAAGLLDHGGSTIRGYLTQPLDSATSPKRPYTLPFLVTGLTSGTSYNFDLAAAVTSTDTLTVYAIGQSSTSPTLASGSEGAPVLMIVQAV